MPKQSLRGPGAKGQGSRCQYADAVFIRAQDVCVAGMWRVRSALHTAAAPFNDK